MVTHDMGAVEYCDRVITLRDGRIGSNELVSARRGEVRGDDEVVRA